MRTKSIINIVNSKALIGKNINEANIDTTKDVAKSMFCTKDMIIAFDTITKKDTKLIIFDYIIRGLKCQ